MFPSTWADEMEREEEEAEMEADLDADIEEVAYILQKKFKARVRQYAENDSRLMKSRTSIWPKQILKDIRHYLKTELECNMDYSEQVKKLAWEEIIDVYPWLE